MNRLRTLLFLILAFVSVSCSKLLDLGNDAEKDADPVPVSMEYDGIYIKENLPERTQSQFYLRKHSFSYFLSTYFTEGGLQIRMLISSGEEFELDKWYNLPTAETEDIWESFAEIEYDKGYFPNEEDKKAIAGKVKFTKFNGETLTPLLYLPLEEDDIVLVPYYNFSYVIEKNGNMFRLYNLLDDGYQKDIYGLNQIK